MHILFLTDNFPPEVNAPANRTHEHCREWVRAGHRVTVITCAPNFPRGQVFEGYRNRLWQSEQVDGIRVIRVWTYIARNQGFARRVLDFLSFMVMSFLAALFVRRIDVIIGTSPQFFTACSACAVSMLRRRPFVFELRDLWPESIRAVSAIRSERLLDMLERIEMFLYRRATRIIAVTHSFRATLIARGIDGVKIDVVTNGVDVASMAPVARDIGLCDDLGLRQRFVAGYIGTLGMAHALETLIETARLLAQRPDCADMHLLFLGDGACRDRLCDLSAGYGLANVTLLRSVPHKDVSRYASLLDVSIIHLKRTPLFQTVIPSKMFECMAMGVPILHGVEGESAALLKKAGAGVTVVPENPAAMADTLVRLRDDPALRARLSAAGMRAAPLYDRRKLAADMLEVLEQVTGADQPIRSPECA